MKDVYTIEDLRDWAAATADERPPLRLAVFGDPVAHSASPQMHNPALAACGIEARYCRLHIRPHDLAEALHLLPAKGFIGANLTIPHKTAALALVDEADDLARKLGAVNTVLVDGDRLIGYNTDGPGFVRAIRAEFSVDVKDLRVMVIGAGGGAGRAIAIQCAIEGCERLALVNRTPEKTAEILRDLAPHFGGPKVAGPVERLEAVPWEEEALRFQLEHTDLVVNATSVGMKPSDPPLLPAAWLLPHLLVYDAVYSSRRTPLMQAALAAGARAAGGASMLLHQGALSFEIWFGREAPLETMRRGMAAA